MMALIPIGTLGLVEGCDVELTHEGTALDRRLTGVRFSGQCRFSRCHRLPLLSG
jgi:hypothetical protein